MRRDVWTILAALVSDVSLAEGFWDQFKDPAVDGGLGLVGLFFHETEEQKEKRLEALRNAEDGSQYLLTPPAKISYVRSSAEADLLTEEQELS